MIRVEAQVTAEALLKAVEQMSQQELEIFVTQVLRLRARREAPSLSAVESELLLKINQGIPHQLQCRFDELVAKRRNLALTQPEQEELIQITEQIEQLDAERIELLGKLAQLRSQSLSETMQELGIQPPACV
jgi:hypothetical protein